MINQIAQTDSRCPDPVESLLSEFKSDFRESLKECGAALKSPPAITNPLEYQLALAITFTSIMTVVAPMFIFHPLTRVIFATALAVSLLLLLGHRLSIVRGMTKEQVHSLVGMIATAFLFGLAVALVISEVVQITT